MLQSKAVAGDTALDVLDTAMRVGGGAAFRKDIGIERHFRDARASAVMAPDARRAAATSSAAPCAACRCSGEERPMSTRPFTLGAVAYDPKVVTIWEGFTDWFADHDFAFDYVLFSNYEAQAEAHLAGAVDVTWDSPAGLGAHPPARRRGRAAAPAPWRCATPTRTSPRSSWCAPTATIADVAGLAGRTVATGALDSPQATLLPLAHLAERGLDPASAFAVQRFDVMVGKHGDHVGGERDAVAALVGGSADAACVIDGNQLAFAQRGHDRRRTRCASSPAPRRTTTAR